MLEHAETTLEKTHRLFQDALHGEAHSLGPLLEAHREYLTLHCRLQIGSRLQRKVDPTDVVQDIFLDAYRQFPQFRGETYPHFLGWIRMITSGHLAQLLRRYFGTEQRNILLEQSLEHDLSVSMSRMEDQLITSETSPSGKASHAERALAVARAIESLPPDYRDVIILRQMESLPFTQVAERMQKTVDSVQKLWMRALDQLRQVLPEG